MKKKVDARVRTLIESSVAQNHRSFFVIVGDNGKDQVVNLHYMLSKVVVRARPSVLWCYKKELGFSTHKKKRMRKMKKMMARGMYDASTEDPFDLFVSSTNIRYCYYNETQNILGSTYGMLVLQDFEALTPNLLARTIETVEGGGLVIMLLKTMQSLKQLYSLSLDCHSRFRTKGDHSSKIVARFNERFLLSLTKCSSCLVMDDELNILPISSHVRSLASSSENVVKDELSTNEMELAELKKSLKDHQPMGSLVGKCKTIDQAKSVLTFIEAIAEKTLRSTVALTASRGRGKSAALGLAISAAVALGYSNIFVTSPSPENLKTLFEFIFKGFDALDYKEHMDYGLVESTDPDLKGVIVRVNIWRDHRQTIQYIIPTDAAKLGQAELLVVDEAAAIPLPYVKALLGPYLVFISSTVNGYEGTGRALSLKLITQLRAQGSSTGDDKQASARTFRDLRLEEPIRYSPGDPVEKWLNQLLCLDCNSVDLKQDKKGCPHPSKCDLYYVNKDTLFSFHTASEQFLQKMMALYVSSHYKNTPNDLLLMSDNPSHHLFALLGPVSNDQAGLPEILCVIQLGLEGGISKQHAESTLGKGERAAGDLIPWTLSQQFQDTEFAGLSGARIVRIATHPDYQRMGYGRRALEQLSLYFEGMFSSLDEEEPPEVSKRDDIKDGDLNTEIITPRQNLPPLLATLSERKAERLDYLGTSFGLTSDLFGFWKKSGYVPLYIRQTANSITGEHSCIMVKALNSQTVSPEWLSAYLMDFKRRFITLLGYNFRAMPAKLAFSVLVSRTTGHAVPKPVNKDELMQVLTEHDLRRLDSYSRNLLDYHAVMDLIPPLARLFFLEKIPIDLSPGQRVILLGFGAQFKTVEQLADQSELKLAPNQVLALFNKALRKVASFFESLGEEEEGMDGQRPKKPKADELAKKAKLTPLMDELDEAARKTPRKGSKNKPGKAIPAPLTEFAVQGDEAEWSTNLKKTGSIPASVSIKSSKKRRKSEADRMEKKWNSKSRKKRRESTAE